MGITKCASVSLISTSPAAPPVRPMSCPLSRPRGSCCRRTPPVWRERAGRPREDRVLELPQWPRGVTCSLVEPGSGSDHCLLIRLSVPTVKYSESRLSAIKVIYCRHGHIELDFFLLFLYWGTVALSRRILCARAHQSVYIPAPFLVGTLKNCLWS